MTKTLAVIAGLAAVMASGAMAAGHAAPKTASVSVRSSAYGPILFDGRGKALYVFTKDKAGRSLCSGACATAWPPFVVGGSVNAGAGVKAGLLGTTRRADGSRQVTYAGRPLYFYVGDTKAGQVRCQNVFEYGGLWLVVRGSGLPVK
jgi:predicted lipoprotein with Yx(FWY)xxD motif